MFVRSHFYLLLDGKLLDGLLLDGLLLDGLITYVRNYFGPLCSWADWVRDTTHIRSSSGSQHWAFLVLPARLHGLRRLTGRVARWRTRCRIRSTYGRSTFYTTPSSTKTGRVVGLPYSSEISRLLGRLRDVFGRVDAHAVESPSPDVAPGVRTHRQGLLFVVLG